MPGLPRGLHRAALSAVILLAGLGATPRDMLLAGVAFAQTAPAATPQPVATQDDQAPLTQAQLEQLLAPIALYPDDLLMQMLMAATYPLEIVQAKRWLGQADHAKLQGDALGQALNGQSWDPSVKSLVPFPDVLTLMNDQLDWTQQLGDAVLAQQDDVMNAIQVLRGRAQAAGKLQTTPQQTVTVVQNVTTAPAPAGSAAPPVAVAPPPQIITIAPTDPQQVFVPAYNPSVVYGDWPYPANPPVYYPPPVGWGVGNAILTGMAFAGGAAVVNSLWGWARPGWGAGHVDVDVNRFNNINVNRPPINNPNWQHDINHRHGVAYRNDQVRTRVEGNRPGGPGIGHPGRGPGSGPGGGIDRAHAREEFRGRMNDGGLGHGPGGPGGLRPDGNRSALGDRHPGGGMPGGAHPGGQGNRPALADRHPGGGGSGGPGGRPQAGNRQPGGGHPAVQRPTPGQRPAIQHQPNGRPQARPTAPQRGPQSFQGLGNGGHERMAAQRGAASRQGQPAARMQAQQRAASRPAPSRPHGGGGGGGVHRPAGGGGGGGFHGGGGHRGGRR